MRHRASRGLIICVWAVAVAGCSPGKLRVELIGHGGEVLCVAITPDGATVATAGNDISDGTVRLWNAANGSVKKSLSVHARGLVFSSDGGFLATADANSVVLWDPQTGERKRELNLAPKETGTGGAESGRGRRTEPRIGWNIAHIAVAPDGKRLAAASAPIGGTDPSSSGAAMWDLGNADSTPQRWIAGARGCLAFSPDGRILAVGGGGVANRDGATTGSVSLFDAATGERIANLTSADSSPADPGGVTSCLAFSPDGKILASGGADTEPLVAGTPGLNANRASVKLWDVPSARLLATYDGGLKQYKSLAFGPDGKKLFVAGGNPFPTMKNGAVKIYDVASKKEIATVVEMQFQIQSMALSSDGKTLVLACNNLGGDKDREAMRQILQMQRGVGAKPEASVARQYKDTIVQVWSLR